MFAFLDIPLGQFYNGRPFGGILWADVPAFLPVHSSALCAPAGFFFLVACTLDAHSTACEIGNRAVPFAGISRHSWAELMIALPVAVAFLVTGIREIYVTADPAG
jgi:hypothetical protein